MANLRQTLYAWRDNEAAKKGVELFRILPSSAIDEIVRKMPKTKEELTAIKGIKEAKYNQYGSAILNMIKEGDGASPRVPLGIEPDAMTPISYITDGVVLSAPKEERMFYSVSTYLDIVNRELWRMRAVVKGEVTSFKEQGKAVYFSLRDEKDGSTLSVFMWLSDFALAGITLSEGLEVIVEGRSEIYKPSGRFSFRADTIEFAGEGAYKKAYEELKKKFLAEGLFAPERKRQLKNYPVRIGLVTSRGGAVIHDFLSNLGKFGYHTMFVDARVEGAGAVKDILFALTELAPCDLDALVLIRGGGSLESLQAFNNEHIVRAIAEFPAVTICAIGHDKDVPLVQLVADYAPSTPTATTTLLNASWEESIHELALLSRELCTLFVEDLHSHREEITEHEQNLGKFLRDVIRPFRDIANDFRDLVTTYARALGSIKEEIRYAGKQLHDGYKAGLTHSREILAMEESVLHQNDPIRQLQLGFSIIMHSGCVVRSISHLAPGDHFEARLADGTLGGEVTDTTTQ